GSRGFSEFEKLIRYIKITYPQTPIIADVKRGDLANTAKEYSKYYFDELGVDSVTLSPYMGKDSIEPFLKMSKGHVFLLCLTSNPSSSDFQKLKTSDDIFFYKEVAKFSDLLNQEFHNQVGIVVGGTHPKEIGDLRKTHKELNFLIPGYGAQGGSLEDIVKNSGPNSIINSSRSIIFSSSGKNFSDSAKLKAIEINNEMKKLYQKALLQNKILK
ncbi:MAG: orotidine-5'-phosphate decarboxylase, partial [Leptospiraceae bacterium]|nr:orotidine-5'-phosphate decarboxylase [Leptospiraceae bacterium]